MKTLIKNLKTYGLLTILMVGGLIIAFSAFKAKEVKLEEHEYYFTGSNLEQVTQTTNWDQSSTMSCGSNGLLPCKIVIPDDQTLDQYLSSKTPEQILAAAETRRN